MDERSSLGTASKRGCFFRNARARNTHVEATLNHPFAAQVYTGNFLDGVAGRGGTRYGRHAGLCLETQLFPDALHNAHFPSAVLRPGSTYAHATEHVFSAAAARPAL